MYEQDAVVRMQLGKRLEQVLMDKEDALEQIEFYKVRHIVSNFVGHYPRKSQDSYPYTINLFIQEQLNVLRESLALMGQNASPVYAQQR